MWFLPVLTGQYTRKITIHRGQTVLKNLDQGWLEYLTVGMLYSLLYSLANLGITFQSNRLKNHFLLFIFWLLLILFYMI